MAIQKNMILIGKKLLSGFLYKYLQVLEQYSEQYF